MQEATRGTGLLRAPTKHLVSEKGAADIYREIRKMSDKPEREILSNDEIEHILIEGPRFKAREAELVLFKGVAKNKPSNVGLIFANEGLAPWILPHIGCSEEGVMEVICYTDDEQKVQEAVEKFNKMQKLEVKKLLCSLSPKKIRNLYNRMEKVRSEEMCQTSAQIAKDIQKT